MLRAFGYGDERFRHDDDAAHCDVDADVALALLGTTQLNARVVEGVEKPEGLSKRLHQWML